MLANLKTMLVIMVHNLGIKQTNKQTTTPFHALGLQLCKSNLWETEFHLPLLM